MLLLFLGVTFCVFGSWLSNSAQIVLKAWSDEKARLEMAELPPMSEYMNLYLLKYVSCFVASAGFDVTSQVFLTQIMWATVSALDILWYKLFSWYWFADAMEVLEIVSMGNFIGGVVLTILFEPDSRESTMNGFQEYVEAWRSSLALQIFSHTFAFVSLVSAGIYLYSQRRIMDADPERFPPNWEPRPSAPFNLVGIYVNGSSTAMFFIVMYILTNTVIVSGEIESTLSDKVCAFLMFVPIYFLSFGMDFWSAANLHNITQVPCTLMWATIFQVGTNFLVWGITFDDSGPFTKLMWHVGIGFQVIGILSWVCVQDYRFTRDQAQEGEEEQEAKEEEEKEQIAQQGDGNDADNGLVSWVQDQYSQYSRYVEDMEEKENGSDPLNDNGDKGDSLEYPVIVGGDEDGPRSQDLNV